MAGICFRSRRHHRGPWTLPVCTWKTPLSVTATNSYPTKLSRVLLPGKPTPSLPERRRASLRPVTWRISLQKPGQCCPPGDCQQCSGDVFVCLFFVFTTDGGGGSSSDILWVKAKDSAKAPQDSSFPQQRVVWLKMSIVLKLKNCARIIVILE